MTNQKSIDAPSYLGIFGWEKIGGEDFAIPVIVRSNETRYSPVRIVEQEIIKKYDALPQSVFQCITLKSFYLTTCEAKLLNNVNFNHCNNRYGETFFSSKDVIISAADVKELSQFLHISHKIFTQDLSQFAARYGIIRLTLDPQNPSYTLLVPYIVKAYVGSNGKQVRFIPFKLVESYLMRSNTTVVASPSDWDIMYLKMLSIYCENNSQQYITCDNSLSLLEGLLYKNTNRPAVYEDYKTQNWQT